MQIIYSSFQEEKFDIYNEEVIQDIFTFSVNESNQDWHI